MTTSGSFSGTQDLEYVVEIDSVSGGAEVGSATFRWSDDGGITWDADGVTTSASATLLGDGVYIEFTAGTGNDFVLGDTWYLRGINYFNPAKLIDSSRDTRYRSSGLDNPNWIKISLDSAVSADCIAIYDHNFSSSAVITIQGNASDSWGAPTFSETVTWNNCKILHYFASSQSFQYWRLVISDETNAAAYIQISELCLGEYLALSRAPAWGRGRDNAFVGRSLATEFGSTKRLFRNWSTTLNYSFDFLTETDINNLLTMITAISSQDTGAISPIFFNEISDTPNEFWLVTFDNIGEKYEFDGRYSLDLSLSEVMKSA
jgi:hypothetical protein